MIEEAAIESFGRAELVNYIKCWTAAYADEIGGAARASEVCERFIDFYTRDADVTQPHRYFYLFRYMEVGDR